MQAQYVLPLVDISKLQSPDLTDRIEVAHTLDHACKEVGFLYLQGSQFNFDYAKALIEMAQSYFSQDLNTKMQHYIGKSKNHSGYVPIGEEQFAGNSYDLKEAYDVNYDYQGTQKTVLSLVLPYGQTIRISSLSSASTTVICVRSASRFFLPLHWHWAFVRTFLKARLLMHQVSYA